MSKKISLTFLKSSIWTFAILVPLASTPPWHVTRVRPITHNTSFSGHGSLPKMDMYLGQANQSLSQELGISSMKVGLMNTCFLSALGPWASQGLECWQQCLWQTDKDSLWHLLLMDRVCVLGEGARRGEEGNEGKGREGMGREGKGREFWQSHLNPWAQMSLRPRANPILPHSVDECFPFLS